MPIIIRYRYTGITVGIPADTFEIKLGYIILIIFFVIGNDINVVIRTV